MTLSSSPPQWHYKLLTQVLLEDDPNWLDFMARNSIDDYLDQFEPKPWGWYIFCTWLSLYVAYWLILLAYYIYTQIIQLLRQVMIKLRKSKRKPRKVIKEYLLPKNGTIRIAAEKQYVYTWNHWTTHRHRAVVKIFMCWIISRVGQ